MDQSTLKWSRIRIKKIDLLQICFIFQVLRLVHYLVLFGFYDKSEDIKKLLEPLMSLLDGRNDKPYPKCEGRITSLLYNKC